MPPRKYKVIPAYKSERIADKDQPRVKVGYQVCSFTPWEEGLRTFYPEVYTEKKRAKVAMRQKRRELLESKAAALRRGAQAKYWPSDTNMELTGVITTERNGKDKYGWRPLTFKEKVLVAGNEGKVKLSRLERYEYYGQNLVVAALAAVEEGEA